MSWVLIVAAHMSGLCWYPHGAIWSEHWDYQCASTLQILLLILRSRSLLLDLEEVDHCANSFAQIWWDLNQITMKRRKTLLLLYLSLSFSLLYLISIRFGHGWSGEGRKRRWEGRFDVRKKMFFISHARLLSSIYFCHSKQICHAPNPS